MRPGGQAHGDMLKQAIFAEYKTTFWDRH